MHMHQVYSTPRHRPGRVGVAAQVVKPGLQGRVHGAQAHLRRRREIAATTAAVARSLAKADGRQCVTTRTLINS